MWIANSLGKMPFGRGGSLGKGLLERSRRRIFGDESAHKARLSELARRFPWNDGHRNAVVEAFRASRKPTFQMFVYENEQRIAELETQCGHWELDSQRNAERIHMAKEKIEYLRAVNKAMREWLESQ
jgi:hypothetical protein